MIPTALIKYNDIPSPWSHLCICANCKWWGGWRLLGHVCRKPWELGGRHKGTLMGPREKKDCWERDL